MPEGLKAQHTSNQPSSEGAYREFAIAPHEGGECYWKTDRDPGDDSWCKFTCQGCAEDAHQRMESEVGA